MKNVAKKLVVALLTAAILIGSTSSVSEAKWINVTGRYKAKIKGDTWYIDVSEYTDGPGASIEVYSHDAKMYRQDELMVISKKGNTKMVTKDFYYTTGLKFTFSKKKVKVKEVRRNGAGSYITVIPYYKLSKTYKKVKSFAHTG